MQDGLAALLVRDMGASEVRISNLRGLAGGYSRETFAFDADFRYPDGRSEQLALILRRDPVASSAIIPTSRPIEHRLLQRVAAASGVPAPRSLALDATGEFVERPALVITRLPGKSDLAPLFGGADADQLESVATNLCETLAKLHLSSINAIDPDGEMRDPMNRGIDTSSWEAYFASQVAFLKGNYPRTAFSAHPVLYDTYCTLEHARPAPAPLTFVHGDFQPSNYMYEDGKISGLIDWELCHIGDPREDLGALIHVSALMGWDLVGAVKREGDFLGYYSSLTGIPVTRHDVEYFRMLWLCGILTPTLEAVKHRLEGEHDNFMHIYLMQPIMAGFPPFAAQLGYPTVSGDA